MSTITVNAKLPVGWNEKEKKIISQMEQVTAKQAGNLREAVKFFGGENALVAAVNDLLKVQAVRAEYATRVAAVRPSNTSPEKREQIAVNALVRTGKYTLDEAKKIVAGE